MVPIPDEADEDARRCVRERTELLSDRVGLTNRIGAVLATLGVNDYNPLLQSRRRRLAELRTGLDEPIPPNALAKIERLLARLELVLAQIAELERERDEVAGSSFYRWYDRYQRGGPEALADRPSRPDRVWNRIPEAIRSQIVDLALD
jgi:transposase